MPSILYKANPSKGNGMALVTRPSSSNRTVTCKSSSLTVNAVSPHPDAVQRRIEREAERQRQESERQAIRAAEAQGMQWWEGPMPSNMIVATSEQQLKELVKQANAQGALAVVNYFTSSCYICRTLHPKLKRIAQDNPDVLFVKVNGSLPALEPVFIQMGIEKVPVIQFVRDGEVKHSMSCSLSPEKLMQLRAEIAAYKAPATHPPLVYPPLQARLGAKNTAGNVQGHS